MTDQPGFDLGATADDPEAPATVATATAVRHVSVAIDAAGGGGARPYTYAVPASLADLVDGEAVLVEFGRRQALGIVLGAAPAPEGVVAKPISGRVRADGPLLPPLALRLAAWIAEHYLAPPALVVRAMLPPGMLERLELLAERTAEPAATGSTLAPADLDLLDQLERGPRPIRDLVTTEGRPTLVRRLRALEDSLLVTLDWTLLAAGVGPRYERWVRFTPDGRAAAELLASGLKAPGRALGPRQIALLEEVREAGSVTPAVSDGLAAAGLGDRHGTAAVAGLVRRGLLEVEVRER
nr:hypothetical protein [Chloroflexota bacterium]